MCDFSKTSERHVTKEGDTYLLSDDTRPIPLSPTSLLLILQLLESLEHTFTTSTFSDPSPTDSFTQYTTYTCKYLSTYEIQNLF